MTKSISAIVEFFELDDAESRGGEKWEIFTAVDEDGNVHPYLDGVSKRLKSSNGIYIFYDSRGRALYVGKAENQSLWQEMKSAYNRDRNDKQKIRLVTHPTRKIRYSKEKSRRITYRKVQLHELAYYFSAYEVPKPLISSIEALLIRAFANDLLNAKMESI